MRQGIRAGVIASAAVFTAALLLCLVSLPSQHAVSGPWPGNWQPGVYVLGIRARGDGVHITSAVLVWCLAIPFALTVTATSYRLRRQRAIEQNA